MPMLVGYVQSLGMKLGMVVDLTKTDRFYDKRELQQKNIGHYKLKCEGYVYHLEGCRRVYIWISCVLYSACAAGCSIASYTT